jgi:hypothetical protein
MMASNESILDYLRLMRGTLFLTQSSRTEELLNINLSWIAWRLKEKEFFQQVISILEDRFVYERTIWSYGIYHNIPHVALQYLQKETSLVSEVGPYLRCPLLVTDPQEIRSYEHLEYGPIFNSRAHVTTIANDSFNQHYKRVCNLFLFIRLPDFPIVPSD